MADINMVRKHRAQSLEEAQTKVQALLTDLRSSLDRHIDKIEWNDERTEARLSGKHVKGTFKVDPENVFIELNLSLMARLAKGIIEKRIDEIIQERFYGTPNEAQ